MPEIIDPVFAKTSQNARFLYSENERFGLVFVKTGSINSGTNLGSESAALSDIEFWRPLIRRYRRFPPSTFSYTPHLHGVLVLETRNKIVRNLSAAITENPPAIYLSLVSLTPVNSLSPVSLTPVINIHSRISPRISKTVLMEYLGAQGTKIHEKKPEVENLMSDSH